MNGRSGESAGCAKSVNRARKGMCEWKAIVDGYMVTQEQGVALHLSLHRWGKCEWGTVDEVVG